MEMLGVIGGGASIPGTVEYPDAVELKELSVREHPTKDTGSYRFTPEVNLRIRVIFFSFSYRPGESFKVEDSINRVVLNTFASKEEALKDLEKLHEYIAEQARQKDFFCAETFLNTLRECVPEERDFLNCLAYRLVHERTKERAPRLVTRRASVPTDSGDNESLKSGGPSEGKGGLQPMPVSLARARSLPNDVASFSEDVDTKSRCTIS